jgi:hypothetical protein
MIFGEGVVVDPEKVKAVVEWTRATSVFEIRSFLGLAGYYRHFVEGFSNLSRPLSAFTKKNPHYVWTDEYEHSFEELKKRLVTAPVLALPTRSRNFVVYSDTTKKGLRCVLMQNCNVITYAFTSAEALRAELSYTRLGVGSCRVCSKDLEALLIWREV